MKKGQTIKIVLLSAAGGAIVWWIVLSAVFGWMTAGSAEKKAEERAEAAVLDALVPLCVALFNQDGERETKLEALKKASIWKQDAFVIRQGWATMPDGKKPDPRVARRCASRILATSGS